MFGFFKKAPVSEEEKRAESLPRTKKVEFVDALPISGVENELDRDIRTVVGYTPVNYYDTKDSSLMCIFYYSEDYSEIYMRFQHIVYDTPKEKSKLWKIDKELMRDILRKFGQNI